MFIFNHYNILSIFASRHICIQVLRENNFNQTIDGVKIEDGAEITYEKPTTTLRKGTHHLVALQTRDGHWPAQIAGPLFYMPPLVSIYLLTAQY